MLTAELTKHPEKIPLGLIRRMRIAVHVINVDCDNCTPCGYNNSLEVARSWIRTVVPDS